jgi:hypothetical protein
MRAIAHPELPKPQRRRPNRRTTRRLCIEALEARELLAVSPEEQFFIYRLNRARFDPAAYQQEAGLPISLDTVAARPPLAVNTSLDSSAEFKAEELAQYGYFAHQSAVTGVWPNKLVRDNGYPLPATLQVGGSNYLLPDNGNSVESLAAGYGSAVSAMDGLIVDQGINPPGHRQHLLGMTPLYAEYREIGIGHAYNSSSPYGNYWAIHLTASNTQQSFLTGVVHADANGNQRYDAGEGLGGVTITVGDQQAITNPAGGWSLPVAAGQYVVTAAGGGFAGQSSVPVDIGSENVEVDFVSGIATGYVNFTRWGNTAPLLNSAGSPTLSPVVRNDDNPAGATIQSFAGDLISDPDPASVAGIAVIASGGPAPGTWQFSVDGGDSWTGMGAVSTSAARLLRTQDLVRFVPALDAVGTATLDFVAWDQTNGVAGQMLDLPGARGGTTAFSTDAETVTLSVIPANTAPILDTSTSPQLPDVLEDSVQPAGVSLGELLGSSVTDPDPGAVRGVALVGTGGLAGSWQFRLVGETSWQAIGDVDASTARLLRAEDWVRFVPQADLQGPATLQFHAWDQMSGRPGERGNLSGNTGGTSAFSEESNIAQVTVQPVNDAPVLDASLQLFLPPIPSNQTFSASAGETTAGIYGSAIGDVDPGALRGIAVTSVSAGGTWWFRNDGVWRSGTVSPEFAWLLKPNDKVQFVPNAGFGGTVFMIFHAWDQTTGAETSGIWADVSTSDRTGGTTAYSATSQTASLFVGDAGAAPQVLDVARLDPSPTSAESVRYRVRFDANVVNVDSSDFRLTTSGSLSAAISGVTGGGAEYVVTVAHLSGSGALHLEFEAMNVDIRDTLGNRLNLSSYAGSPTYEFVGPVAAPWQNPMQRLDVNNDGTVAPNDVLALVNDLNSKGSRMLPPPQSGGQSPPPYLDVNGDNSVAPNDVLGVVNYLNNRRSGEGESLGVREIGVKTPEPPKHLRRHLGGLHSIPRPVIELRPMGADLVETPAASTRAGHDHLVRYLPENATSRSPVASNACPASRMVLPQASRSQFATGSHRSLCPICGRPAFLEIQNASDADQP